MMEVVWCNSHAHETVEMPLFLDEVKSVYVAEDQTTWRDFIRFRNENMQMPVTVFVYTHHSFSGMSTVCVVRISKVTMCLPRSR